MYEQCARLLLVSNSVLHLNSELLNRLEGNAGCQKHGGRRTADPRHAVHSESESTMRLLGVQRSAGRTSPQRVVAVMAVASSLCVMLDGRCGTGRSASAHSLRGSVGATAALAWAPVLHDTHGT